MADLGRATNAAFQMRKGATEDSLVQPTSLPDGGGDNSTLVAARGSIGLSDGRLSTGAVEELNHRARLTTRKACRLGIQRVVRRLAI